MQFPTSIKTASDEELLEFSNRLVRLQREIEIPAERLALVNAARAAVRELKIRQHVRINEQSAKGLQSALRFQFSGTRI